MGESYPAYIDEIKHDLHGETVGIVHTTPILVCDYCDEIIDTSAPIMYEALRVADIPALERLDPPEEWVLDAARCRDCEIERVTPATTGYDEALLMLAVSEADGIQSVDASTLSIVDLSPTTDGYAPPVMEMQPLIAPGDLGYGRWLRIQAHIENMQTSSVAPPETVEMLQDVLSRSKDIPPGIDL